MEPPGEKGPWQGSSSTIRRGGASSNNPLGSDAGATTSVKAVTGVKADVSQGTKTKRVSLNTGSSSTSSSGGTPPGGGGRGGWYRVQPVVTAAVTNAGREVKDAIKNVTRPGDIESAPGTPKWNSDSEKEAVDWKKGRVRLKEVLRQNRSLSSFAAAFYTVLTATFVLSFSYYFATGGYGKTSHSIFYAKDALNTLFDDVPEIDQGGEKRNWREPVSYLETLVYMADFYETILTDNDARWNHSDHDVLVTEGLYMKWSTLLVNFNPFCNPVQGDIINELPGFNRCIAAYGEMNATRDLWVKEDDRQLRGFWKGSSSISLFTGTSTRDELRARWRAVRADLPILAESTNLVSVVTVYQEAALGRLFISFMESASTERGKSEAEAKVNRAPLYMGALSATLSQPLPETYLWEPRLVVVGACAVISILLLLWMVVREINSAQMDKLQHGTVAAYFKQGWHIINIFAIASAFTGIIMTCFTWTWMVPITREHIGVWDMDLVVFAGLSFMSSTVVIAYLGTVVAGTLLAITVFRYFHELHPGLALFAWTLRHAGRPLIDIVTTSFYIIVVISWAVYLIFAWLGANQSFKTFANTFLNIVNLCLGFYDYEMFVGGREFAWTVMVVFLSLLFVISVFGLVIICQNIILAVIGDAYDWARKQIGDDINEYPNFFFFLLQVLLFAISYHLLLLWRPDKRELSKQVVEHGDWTKFKKKKNKTKKEADPMKVGAWGIFWRQASACMVPETTTFLKMLELIGNTSNTKTIGSFGTVGKSSYLKEINKESRYWYLPRTNPSVREAQGKGEHELHQARSSATSLTPSSSSSSPSSYGNQDLVAEEGMIRTPDRLRLQEVLENGAGMTYEEMRKLVHEVHKEDVSKNLVNLRFLGLPFLWKRYKWPEPAKWSAPPDDGADGDDGATPKMPEEVEEMVDILFCAYALSNNIFKTGDEIKEEGNKEEKEDE